MSSTPSDTNEIVARKSVFLGLAVKVRLASGQERLQIRWAVVLTLVLLCGVGAWFGKSVAFYLFFRNVRDFEEVKFTDMLAFPINRESVRVAQGDYQVERAYDAVDRRDFGRALRLAQEGVARSPSNMKGYRLLYDFYRLFRPDLAMSTIERAVRYTEDDFEIHNLYLVLLLENRRFNEAATHSLKLLARELEGEERQQVIVSALRAYLALNDFQAIEQLYHDQNLEYSPAGIAIVANALWRLEREEDAVLFLEQALERVPANQRDPIFNTLTDMLQRLERWDDATEYTLQWMIQRPLSWRPRIVNLSILHNRGLQSRIDKETASILQQFGRNQEAMAALGQYAADSGNVELAAQVYTLAMENSYNPALFGLLYVETHLTAKQFEECLALCAKLEQEDPNWLQQQISVFSTLKAIASFGLNDNESGRLFLEEFNSAQEQRPEVLRTVAGRLREVGETESALQLLNEALKRDPSNPFILEQLILLKLEEGLQEDLLNDVTRLVDLPLRNYELLATLQTQISSDRFLFTDRQEDLVSRVNGELARMRSAAKEFFPMEEPDDQQG